MATNDTTRAEEQAKAQLDSIIAMVERLEHARECDGEDCELTNEEVYDGLELYNPGGTPTDEEREQYHNEDEAQQRINESPLSVQVRSDWYSPGETPEAEEYEILLCTGGPAVRIRGALGAYNEPDQAYIEYQDWFTSWTQYFSDREDTLLTYVQQFYFGD